MMTNYQIIESHLVRLLSMMDDVFKESEVEEVMKFIDVGEYGLALDTLVGIVQDESKSISLDSLELAKSTASAMELDGKLIEDQLIDFVRDS